MAYVRAKGRMKRSYLKHNKSGHDRNAPQTMRDSIGLGRDINPVIATPKRAVLWLDTHKHTPVMTQPMKEKIELVSNTLTVKHRHGFMKILCDTPDQYIRLFYSTLEERGQFYFKRLNRLTGVEWVSYTLASYTKAMALYNDDCIPWNLGGN